MDRFKKHDVEKTLLAQRILLVRLLTQASDSITGFLKELNKAGFWLGRISMTRKVSASKTMKMRRFPAPSLEDLEASAWTSREIALSTIKQIAVHHNGGMNGMAENEYWLGVSLLDKSEMMND